MTIHLANKNDARQIAKIHTREINQGFLSELGEKFLFKLYEAMVTSPTAFIVTAEENNCIVGFISGCTNLDKFYRDFYKKYAINAFLVLIPKIFKPSTLKKIFETLRYPKREEKSLPEAELLTIAVLKEFHGQGTAQKMFEIFLREMGKRKIKQFKVAVGENLSRAVGFYEKVGFKSHSNITIHQNNLSRIYIYTIR